MGSVPFPLTGTSIQEVKAQVWELMRQVFEEKIGGADLGDVFSMPGDVLTLVLESSTPGLQKVDNTLSVKVAPDGGLILTSNGIYIKTATDGGLETDTDGLGVTPGIYAMLGEVNEDWIGVDATNAFYLGDSDTDGSWRIIRNLSMLEFQRREEGSWIMKHTIVP